MPEIRPLAIGADEAAKMLGLPVDEFRSLVERDALPQSFWIGGEVERWDYAHIKCVALGVAAMAFRFFDADEEWTWADLLAEYEHLNGLTDRPSRHVPLAVRLEVFERDGQRCTYCGIEEPPFHLDHVMPLSRGGETSVDNLVVSCKPCNFDKRARTPEEWREAKEK